MHIKLFACCRMYLLDNSVVNNETIKEQRLKLVLLYCFLGFESNYLKCIIMEYGALNLNIQSVSLCKCSVYVNKVLHFWAIEFKCQRTIPYQWKYPWSYIKSKFNYELTLPRNKLWNNKPPQSTHLLHFLHKNTKVLNKTNIV